MAGINGQTPVVVLRDAQGVETVISDVNSISDASIKKEIQNLIASPKIRLNRIVRKV